MNIHNAWHTLIEWMINNILGIITSSGYVELSSELILLISLLPIVPWL